MFVGGQAAARQRPVARQPRPPWSRSSGTRILKGARRHVLRLPRALATRRERPALATPSAVVPGPVPTTFTHLTPERLAIARSEGRRVGKEGDWTSNTRWSAAN